MSWATKRLDELGRVVTGKTPATTNPNFYGGEVMFVKPSDMEYESYYVTNTNTTVTDQARDSHRNQFIPADAVMFTCIGNTIGKCGISSDECITNQQINSIVVNGENNPKFVYYLLNRLRPLIRGIGLSGGAAQPIINKSTFSAVKVRAPDKRTQDRIADILSAYDDLIENNRRRIALLEEAARLLYREWFVHFRFPGHDDVNIIDGLPEGWGRSVPSGIIANHIGGGWGKDQPQGKEGEPAFVIRGTDIPRVESGDISSVGLRFHGAKSLLSRVLVPYDVVFEVSGGSSSQPIARTLLLTEERLKLWNSDVICASFCKKFAFSTAADALYFFFHVREYRDRGDVLVYQKDSASSLKNFNFDGFMSSYEFLIPPTALRKLFFESIDPIVRHQSVLAVQIQQLTQARDLLLPRLMNGEIAV